MNFYYEESALGVK